MSFKRELNTKPLVVGDLFAVYGTLKKGFGNHQGLNLPERAEFVQDDTLTGGALYTVGFPCLVEVTEETVPPVVVEVYRIKEPGLASSLDRLEGYRPQDPVNSMYTREKVTLDSGMEVDIYIWNEDVDRLPLIADSNY